MDFKKPHKDFPLTVRADGRWCKRIGGVLHYFGQIREDPLGQVAMEKLQREWPSLGKGEPTPALPAPAFTVSNCCDAFLTDKMVKVRNKELTHRTLADYCRMVDKLISFFGGRRKVAELTPEDFASFREHLANNLRPISLKKAVGLIRSVFRYASDNRLIQQPVMFGSSFNPPSPSVIRRDRHRHGPKLFTAKETRLIIKNLKTDPQMRAMVLLGLNCAFGNTDCANLTRQALDLVNGWVTFPRPKTGVQRRIPLWEETITAIRAAVECRPKPANPEDKELIFLTPNGLKWVRDNTVTEGDTTRVVAINAVSDKFRKLLKKLHLNDEGNGKGFYTLRHIFETIGGEAIDQVAVNAIMGHVDGSMAGHYRERISDARLREITDHVLVWIHTE